MCCFVHNCSSLFGERRLQFWTFWSSVQKVSLTRMIESVSSWKSDGWKFSFRSLSEISMNFPTKLDFTVFGSFPICFSNGDRPSFSLLTLSAYRISDKPDLSLVNIICLFVRSLSLIVLINRSICRFPCDLSLGRLYVLFRNVCKTGRTLH